MAIDRLQKQTNINIQEKANLIWEIATHLYGEYKPHEYGKVILPMTVIKRFDDALKDTKKAVALMKKYSAFTLMVANDPGQRVCILDDQDNISWNVVPYNALMGKDTGDQLIAALSKMGRMG